MSETYTNLLDFACGQVTCGKEPNRTRLKCLWCTSECECALTIDVKSIYMAESLIRESASNDSYGYSFTCRFLFQSVAKSVHVNCLLVSDKNRNWMSELSLAIFLSCWRSFIRVTFTRGFSPELKLKIEIGASVQWAMNKQITTNGRYVKTWIFNLLIVSAHKSSNKENNISVYKHWHFSHLIYLLSFTICERTHELVVHFFSVFWKFCYVFINKEVERRKQVSSKNLCGRSTFKLACELWLIKS